MTAAQEKWLNNNWLPTKKGGVYLKNPAMFVCVFASRSGSGWSYSTSFGGRPPKFSRSSYDSIQAAQLGLFNHLYR